MVKMLFNNSTVCIKKIKILFQFFFVIKRSEIFWESSQAKWNDYLNVKNMGIKIIQKNRKNVIKYGRVRWCMRII